MNITSLCLLGSDEKIGPRVSVACRSFDFTLFFEDAFFVALPAVLYLMLLPLRLQALWRMPTKVNSYRLAIYKVALLLGLLALHLLFLGFRLQSFRSQTRLSIASGTLSAVSTLGASIQSLLEDQRLVKPSDMLVLYFSVSTILALPRLRTLWLVPSEYSLKITWTSVFVFTTIIVLVESVKKVHHLQPAYKKMAPEQVVSFWNRSFFIWTLPFFHTGYSSILTIQDIPDVDTCLGSLNTSSKLDLTWDKKRLSHHFRLARATAAANSWLLVSAIVPRLSLSAFLFCQPFLINASVSHLSEKPKENSEYYGQALVGGFVLVYLGIAVSNHLKTKSAIN